MRELAQLALDEAVSAGAEYADVRTVTEDHESLTVQDQRVEGVEQQTSRGVGVRVIVDGSWGFAATVRSDRREVLGAARLAVEVARASATAQRQPVRLAGQPSSGGRVTRSPDLTNGECSGRRTAGRASPARLRGSGTAPRPRASGTCGWESDEPGRGCVLD
ncbi:MAG: PmbA/TldA family metallopeptidase, partial [Egibacteraceae bacterium]